MVKYTARGYDWYTSGIVKAQKALQLVEKFEQLYFIHLNSNQRYYRKMQGKANAKLFLYPIKESQNFLWWLLVTDGQGDAHELEQLYKVYDQKKRLKWDDDYELVRISKEKKSEEVITWRMTKKCRDAWYKRIQSSIRSRSDEEMKQTLWSLHRAPGFSEVRETVKKIKQYAQKEWQRSRKEKTPCVHMTNFIPYVRNPDDRDYLLSLLVKRMSMGLPAFPRADLEKNKTKSDHVSA